LMDLGHAKGFVKSLFLHNESFWRKIHSIAAENIHANRMAMTLLVYLMTNMFETPEISVTKTSHWITKFTTPQSIRDRWIMPNLAEKATEHFEMVSQTESLVLLGTIAPLHSSSLDVTDCFRAVIPILRSLDLNVPNERSIALNGVYAFLNWLYSTKDKFDVVRDLWPAIVSTFSTILLRATQTEVLERHGECIIRYFLRAYVNFGGFVANDVGRVLTLAHPWVFRRASPMNSDLRDELLVGLFEDIAKSATLHGFFKPWLRTIRTTLQDHYMPNNVAVPFWYWKILSQMYDVDREFMTGYIDSEVVERLMLDLEEVIDRLESLVSDDFKRDHDRIKYNFGILNDLVPVLNIYAFEDTSEAVNVQHLCDLGIFRLIVKLYRVLDQKSLWRMHGHDINTLRVNVSGVRYFMLKKSRGPLRMRLWHDLIGPWMEDDASFETKEPEDVVSVIVHRFDIKGWFEASDITVLAPLLTMLASILEEVEDADTLRLDLLTSIETSVIMECEHESVVRIFLFWMCQCVRWRKHLELHPLMLYPFWDLKFPELRAILAQWQSVAIINMLPVEQELCTEMLLDFHCDFEEITRVFRAQEATNYEAKVYLLQFVAVALMLKLYDEPVAEEASEWMQRVILYQIRQGSWETLILLQCVTQWGCFSFRNPADYTTAIREAFVDKLEGSDADKIKTIENIMKTFLRMT
jgi:hypothetical protein